jgi:3-oxoacyl-[acyl-carrier protein] reductase
MSKEVKTAVVTGASRGIGFAIANELAGRGYSLGLTARSQREIEKAAEEISGKFPDVKIVTAVFDVVDGNAVKNFIERVAAKLGNISVLVNNAGYYRTGTSSLPESEARRATEVNYLAAGSFTEAALPSMLKSGSGYIFNIASICGVEAFADTGIYSASKFALVGYSSALNQELAPKGIKVTAICPGWVNTQLAADAPLKPGEMIQTSDIALTVGYLLSLGPSASIREIVIRC